MDDSLQIRPSDLDDTMDNQLDMFTMEHENQYGEMMNELINIFIPPENATKDEMDEAKRNMDKYADYRTYLSFDMQQIVHGDKEMTIGLSKMIKKNSGGGGAGTRCTWHFWQALRSFISQSVAEDAPVTDTASGCAGRGVLQDGCREGGKLYLADPRTWLPGDHQRDER